MNKFDIAALGAEGIAVVIMVLAITALFGKRIYDCYLAGGMRIGKMNRDKQTLTMRSMLAVYPAALALPLSLPPFGLEVNAALWTVVGATIATIAPAVYIYLKANWAYDDVQKATDYTAVALGNFDKFIHTGGDLIGRKDLKITIENGPQHASFAPSDIYVAKYLLANFEDVGHVIKATTKKGLMPTGAPGGMYATKKTVRAYGISRDDLKNYPNVVRKRNARWL